MKYETETKEGNGFHPVTITIEKEEELTMLWHILAVDENMSLNNYVGKGLCEDFKSERKTDLKFLKNLFKLKKKLFDKIDNTWWSI